MTYRCDVWSHEWLECWGDLGSYSLVLLQQHLHKQQQQLNYHSLAIFLNGGEGGKAEALMKCTLWAKFLMLIEKFIIAKDFQKSDLSKIK